jgi:hypothetical protein
LQSALSAFPTMSLSVATVQNIARIFRSMDTLRKIGAKILDKRVKGESSGVLPQTRGSPPGTTVHAGLTDKQFPLLECIQTILPLLSDLTEFLWNAAHYCYQVCRLVYKLQDGTMNEPLPVDKLTSSSYTTTTLVIGVVRSRSDYSPRSAEAIVCTCRCNIIPFSALPAQHPRFDRTTSTKADDDIFGVSTSGGGKDE